MDLNLLPSEREFDGQTGKKKFARPGQSLYAHCSQVSQQCGAFAAAFGLPVQGKLIGFFHDLGKYPEKWQNYLFSGDKEAHMSHAPESAAELLRNFLSPYKEIEHIGAYCIYGHHSSLPDWIAGLDALVCAETHLCPALQGATSADAELIVAELQNTAPEQFPFLIRMLFSALVDADRLDAEASEKDDAEILRGKYDAWETLENRFERFMKDLGEKAADTPINRIRLSIREQCVAAGEYPRGFFSLCVPTGGGKTLSSMAFALQHRRKHQMSRIIYAIPFNSIIEQTAEIYRKIFGPDNLLEHHCNFRMPEEESKESRKYEMAAENWDMPIVVTTTVQLFESLLQGRASASRKLHNIANSIIILDEAQKLPPEHLNSILTSLRVLVDRFGCTVVLCSATIPTLESDWVGREGCQIKGLPAAQKIIADTDALEKSMERTRLTMLGKQSLEDVALRLDKEPQALCIVNTKKRCMDLFDRVTSRNKYHLSTLMCPADRQKTLNRIKADLKEGKEIIIVATSLIEAGVDIDVRSVYREIAGVDSLAQAAGRCNREGKQNCGEVYVFIPPEAQPPGMQSFAAAAAQDCIGDEIHPEMSQSLYQQYFRRYYARCAQCLNSDGYKDAFSDPLHSLQYQFREFGEKFHMIEDEGQCPLVVLFEDAAVVIEQLRKHGPSKAIFRKLRPYTVNVRQEYLDVLKRSGIAEDIYGVTVQTAAGIYIPGRGIQQDNTVSYQL